MKRDCNRSDCSLRYYWEMKPEAQRVLLQPYFDGSIKGYRLDVVLHALEYMHPDINIYWNWLNDDQLREVL